MPPGSSGSKRSGSRFPSSLRWLRCSGKLLHLGKPAQARSWFGKSLLRLQTELRVPGSRAIPGPSTGFAEPIRHSDGLFFRSQIRVFLLIYHELTSG